MNKSKSATTLSVLSFVIITTALILCAIVVRDQREELVELKSQLAPLTVEGPDGTQHKTLCIVPSQHIIRRGERAIHLLVMTCDKKVMTWILPTPRSNRTPL